LKPAVQTGETAGASAAFCACTRHILLVFALVVFLPWLLFCGRFRFDEEGIIPKHRDRAQPYEVAIVHSLILLVAVVAMTEKTVKTGVFACNPFNLFWIPFVGSRPCKWLK
jgi:hypothetical protein